MSDVNFMLLKGSVVLDYEVNGKGKRIIIPESDSRYAEIEAAIKSGDLDLIPGIVTQPVDSLKGDGVTIEHGIVHVGGFPIPTLLNKRMLEQRDGGFPVDNLLALYTNLKANPSYRAREFTFEFLDYHQVPITQDGCFIAYKKIREDWKDSHTGTIDNSVGQVVKMDRNMVDDDPRNTCSAGLHVASWEYAEGFTGSRTVAIKVNPRDVVCVPFDYDGQKMRVCEYEVIKEMESPEKDLVWPENDDDEDEVCSMCGDAGHDYEDCPDDEDDDDDDHGGYSVY